MEEITILSVSDKIDNRFWGVQDNTGKSYTVWSGSIMEILKANINKKVKVEVKTSGDFNNIRAVTEFDKQAVEEHYNTPAEDVNVPNPTNLLDLKSLNITAMSMVKSAAEMWKSPESRSSLEKLTIDCVKAYKVAKEELNK